MKSLYNISSQYQALMDAIEANEGEITESLGELLSSNETDRETLINALCAEIANASLDTAAVKQEMERLGGRIADNQAKEDRIKKQIAKILRFFNMRSTTKGSTGFAFKTALFSGFTKESTSITFDDARLTEFTILTKASRLRLDNDEFSVENEATVVDKSSKFVTYKVDTTLDRSLAIELIDDKGLNKDLFLPVIDKNAAKAYIKNIEDLDGVEVDPIVSLAVYTTKESLVIK